MCTCSQGRQPSGTGEPLPSPAPRAQSKLHAAPTLLCCAPPCTWQWRSCLRRVQGGLIRGYQVFGEYPAPLTSDGPLEIGRGRFVPFMPWEGIWQPLAVWLGVRDEQLVEARSRAHPPSTRNPSHSLSIFASRACVSAGPTQSPQFWQREADHRRAVVQHPPALPACLAASSAKVAASATARVVQ